MLINRIFIWLFTIALAALSGGVASGQEFPSKPIHILTGPPGGGNDFIVRFIGQGYTQRWGHPVVIENRGSPATISMSALANLPPDGYTLFYLNQTLWLLPFMRSSVDYDPLKDFAPVSLAINNPFVLFVHPSLPVRSIKELIVLAKAKPGQLNYSSTGSGSATHLAGELIKISGGVDIVRINYKGQAAAINGLLGGEVQLMVFPAFLGLPLAKEGKLRALASTGMQILDMAPELPTVAATLPGYEVSSISGLFAPAKTPTAIINRLQQELARMLTTPEANKQFLGLGMQTIGSTPAQFEATIKSEMARWGKVIKSAGIRDN